MTEPEFTKVIAGLARLEEWARNAEKLAIQAESDRKEMMRQLTLLSQVSSQLVEDMQEVKPVTDMVSNIRTKLVGASIVLGLVGSFVVSAFLYFKDTIIKFIWG